MRIVHTEASCGWGGQEIRILTEAAGLIRRGHEVTLLCPAESQIYLAAPKYGLPVIALPIGRKRLGPLLALRRWLAEHINEIDIINTHSSTDSWLTAVACATLKNAPPIVRTRHVSSPINTSATTFWLYQKAVKHIAVTGEPLRHQLARDNGFALDSITSIPTGIDLERYKPRDQAVCREMLGLPTTGMVVGILATLRDWKGHIYLFEAFAELLPQFPDLKLRIIGDGPFLWRLEERVAELNIGHAVSFVGHKENAEIWLATLDLFVLPSYGDEGVSQALMQAMATGLPVITTPVGGLTDLVTNNNTESDTGLLVPPRDSHALAAAMKRLLDDVSLRTRLATAGRIFAQTHCGLDKMLDSMEAMFRRYAKPSATSLQSVKSLADNASHSGK